MIKIPVKQKRLIHNELKKFVPLIHNLRARGKTSEEDARILLNDILSYALGYDKYNELKTEMREKNERLDYVVKLSEGPFARKQNKFDFIIEAKAAHVKLNQIHVDQTLSYCLKLGVDFFVLTNAVKWQLFKVKRSKNSPEAILIHEVDCGLNNCLESLAEEFYVFSKCSYLNKDWKSISQVAKATSVEDVASILLSDKVVRMVARQLAVNSGVKVSTDIVKDIIENQIIKSSVEKINKKLLKKLNVKPERSRREKSNRGEALEDSQTQVTTLASNCNPDVAETKVAS